MYLELNKQGNEPLMIRLHDAPEKLEILVTPEEAGWGRSREGVDSIVELRAIKLSDRPYFVLSDLCDALELNEKAVIRNLGPGIRTQHPLEIKLVDGKIETVISKEDAEAIFGMATFELPRQQYNVAVGEEVFDWDGIGCF